MADYRLSAQVIKRSNGRSSVAAAAYRAAERLIDLRTGETHNYAPKGGVVHAEIFAPDNTPQWMLEREDLWNAVEKVERRKDAQLAREIQLSLPHELTHEQRIELVQGFAQEQFVGRGMIADVCLHTPDRGGDERNHHAHIMLTMRELTADGFGKKNRDWNNREIVGQWREEWASHQNRMLERHGHSDRVDHRSYEDQGIDREPTHHLGPIANAMEANGKPSRIGDENRDIGSRNARRANDLAQAATLQAQMAVVSSGQSRAANADKYQINDQQKKEKEQLELELQEQNKSLIRDIGKQLKTINYRLENSTGVRKFLRNLSGRTRADKIAKLELEKATFAISRAKDIRRDQLKDIHQKQLDLFKKMSTPKPPQNKSEIGNSWQRASTQSNENNSWARGDRGKEYRRPNSNDNDRSRKPS